MSEQQYICSKAVECKERVGCAHGEAHSPMETYLSGTHTPDGGSCCLIPRVGKLSCHKGGYEEAYCISIHTNANTVEERADVGCGVGL